MSLQNFRPLAFGEILDGAFSLYRRNFGAFALTALIPTVVALVALLIGGTSLLTASATGDMRALAGAGMVSLLVFIVGGTVATLVAWGALTNEASEAYHGRPASFSRGLSAGLRRALPLLGSILMTFLILAVAFLAISIVVGLLNLIVALVGLAALSVLFAIVSFIAWFVLFAGAMGAFFAIVPAIVVEGKGPVEAISRSVALARGALLRVVGIMVVAFLITYLPMIAVMLVTGSFTAAMNPDAAAPGMGQMALQQGLSWIVSVLTMPFLASVVVTLYYDRRVRTEALDVQMAADSLGVAGA